VGGVAYRCPIKFRHQVARLEPGTLGRRLRVDLAQKLCVDVICITRNEFQAMVAAANQSGTDASGTGSPTPPPSSNGAAASSSPDSSATPPVLQVNGENPAHIHVGDTYNDLGARITGPTADVNLDITTYVNGTLMNPVQLDTTQAATDTIQYVATDQSGLTSTSKRTVIVETTSPMVPSTDAPTSQATSTDQ
jgi:hypothetical protein